MAGRPQRGGAVGGVGFLVWEGSPLPRPVAETAQATFGRHLVRRDPHRPCFADHIDGYLWFAPLGLLLFALLLLLRPVLTED